MSAREEDTAESSEDPVQSAANGDLAGRRLAQTLREERERRGWTVAELATRSGVSRAMISRVERAQASPTAALLGRWSGAFSLTMSQLLARSEHTQRSLARRADQPLWEDPATGYVRRAVSPPAGGPLELIEVELPTGTDITFPASAYSFLRQQIWMLDGALTLVADEDSTILAAGDCIALGAPAPMRFVNATPYAIRYLVAILR